MSGFPIKKTLDGFDFSFQLSIDKRQIDELAARRFLENGENVVFLGPPCVSKTHLASALGLVAAQHRFSTYYVNCRQLIARRYEKASTFFTSNKTFSQWNAVFTDVTIASANLDRFLHHCTVINIKGESYRLKECKEFMRQKQQIVNNPFQARKHLISVIPPARRKTTKFLRRFLTISLRR